jgi:hypothetical protein
MSKVKIYERDDDDERKIKEGEWINASEGR